MIRPTWNRVLNEPEELRVAGILQQPSDQVLDDIDLLRAELSPDIPMRVFEQAIPAYLATGRPLAMLDQKFAHVHPVDRFASKAIEAPEFRSRVLAGLSAGRTALELRRASAVANEETQTARALEILKREVEKELEVLGIAATDQAWRFSK
jgi:hypothetical protein